MKKPAAKKEVDIEKLNAKLGQIEMDMELKKMEQVTGWQWELMFKAGVLR